MKTYFGFGMADSMFPAECIASRRPLTVEEVKEIVGMEIVSCLNPSHKETIRVMTQRYGVEVAIPEKAPVVKLQSDDRLVIMAVSGLPRLEGRHEYTREEIDGAQFRFGLWTCSVREYFGW